MKLVIAGLLTAASLSFAAVPASAEMHHPMMHHGVMVRHHHQICVMHHHRRVCSWR